MQGTSRFCYRGINSVVVVYSTAQIKCRSTSSCQFTNNRALNNSIVRKITICRSLPKPLSGQFQLMCNTRKQLSRQFDLMCITRNQLFRQFQLIDSLWNQFVRTIATNRQSPRYFVWAIPSVTKTAIVQIIPTDGQSLKSINRQDNSNWWRVSKHHLSGRF